MKSYDSLYIYLFFLLLVNLQVEELHRVYTIQRTLTENLSWKEFDRYSSRKASTQSTLLPCANRDRFEPFAKETTFSSIPTVIGSHRLSQLKSDIIVMRQRLLLFLFLNSFFMA
jgi:hypothetical protein